MSRCCARAGAAKTECAFRRFASFFLCVVLARRGAAKLGRAKARRENVSLFVIAGLDPAIHAERRPGRINVKVF
jgi:hypothetical protein